MGPVAILMRDLWHLGKGMPIGMVQTNRKCPKSCSDSVHYVRLFFLTAKWFIVLVPGGGWSSRGQIGRDD